MIYDLPKSVTIQGVEYPVRTDYREILDICMALHDPDLTEDERVLNALDVFYYGLDNLSPEILEDAVKECYKFINCGAEDDDRSRPQPKLVDWEQDFSYIVAPVNRVCGREIRAVEYMHWWTFVSYYMEIGGDCTFAQIVGIRSKLAKGKSLDKQERQWYRQNRGLVDFKRKYTEADNELFEEWGGA